MLFGLLKPKQDKLLQAAGDFLMKCEGTIKQPWVDRERLDSPLPHGKGCISFHTNGFIITVDTYYDYRSYVPYSSIQGLHEDEVRYDGELLYYLNIKLSDRTIVIRAPSKLKMMAMKDTINRKTGYKFDIKVI